MTNEFLRSAENEAPLEDLHRSILHRGVPHFEAETAAFYIAFRIMSRNFEMAYISPRVIDRRT
jgi:hypothetical protein